MGIVEEMCVLVNLVGLSLGGVLAVRNSLISQAWNLSIKKATNYIKCNQPPQVCSEK